MPPFYYLDSSRVAIIEETIRKENKLQRQHLEREVAAGRIAAAPPPPAPPPPTLAERLGLPAHAAAARGDLGTAFSRSLWTCNPGYVTRDGPRLASVTHTDYAWDAEAVEFLRQSGAFDPAFRKRRDEFVDYVEKAIRLGHRLGKRDGAVAGAGAKAK
ncbi:hypothetical protein Rsub_13041 [Raphidocelis subcapitata]|uniref:Uncharacterized protein n=1 Tax=Raphidocelis subcapitata TaxID=307507 RepID=A0A2V0PKM5_9CHLO|nr:hypothetical protein Rsub_13041 [Raphidocelis subcapitata]|eukprot:GBG00267.1 hypothetical protein Rsub_13041 [Raphidocelis subcapitata]